MRKILISIVGALAFCPAFAVGENIPTSKSYVDSEITQKQDKIAANNGVTQVLTGYNEHRRSKRHRQRISMC